MTAEQLCRYPVLMLYWVALKSKTPLQKWAERLRKDYGDRLEGPLLDAVLLIEKYGTKNSWRDHM